MKKIILIGGGGHCKSVIDVIEQEKRYKINGIVDKPKFLGSKILGYKVIGSDLDLEYLAKKYKNAIITVGQIKSSLVRIKLFNLANKAVAVPLEDGMSVYWWFPCSAHIPPAAVALAVRRHVTMYAAPL